MNNNPDYLTDPREFNFWTELRVRYEETDSMSVVYYGKYYVFFEVARTEYLKNIGYNYIDIEDNGYYFVVVESKCNYISPAKFEDVLKIYAKVNYIRNTSFNFLYYVTKKDNDNPEQNIAFGHTVLVCVDRNTFKPAKIPEYLTKSIQKFEGRASIP